MKKIIGVLGVAVIAVAMFLSTNTMKPSDGLSSLSLTNLKLIETVFAESSYLNGPGQHYDCPGPFTGSGLDCMGYNSYNCMPRTCGN